MITFDDIRRIAAAYPGTEETHVRQPGMRVQGKPFCGVEQGGATGVFTVRREQAAAAVADAPGVYEEVWRKTARMTFVGLRVELDKVGEDRITELVEQAWRNKAPKRVIAAFDAA
ncbi:MAG TPA: MmcQ/YjbR family DNA-binding protein [Phytomonospora sp.]